MSVYNKNEVWKLEVILRRWSLQFLVYYSKISRVSCCWTTFFFSPWYFIGKSYLTWIDMRLFIVFIIPLHWICMCFLAEVSIHSIICCCPDLTRDLLLSMTSVIFTQPEKLCCSRLITSHVFFWTMYACVYVRVCIHIYTCTVYR